MIITRFIFMVGVKCPPSIVHSSGVNLKALTCSHLPKLVLQNFIAFVNQILADLYQV